MAAIVAWGADDVTGFRDVIAAMPDHPMTADSLRRRADSAGGIAALAGLAPLVCRIPTALVTRTADLHRSGLRYGTGGTRPCAEIIARGPCRTSRETAQKEAAVPIREIRAVLHDATMIEEPSDITDRIGLRRFLYLRCTAQYVQAWPISPSALGTATMTATAESRQARKARSTWTAGPRWSRWTRWTRWQHGTDGSRRSTG